MDSGMTKEEKVTLEGLIASGSLPQDDKLSLDEIISVFDQILCCEVIFHQNIMLSYFFSFTPCYYYSRHQFTFLPISKKKRNQLLGFLPFFRAQLYSLCYFLLLPNR
jgi:hypothetical protein